MSVDFCGFDVGVTHQLLNDPDVDAVFQQVRCKRMAKRMATDAFGDSCFFHPCLYGFLKAGFKNVVTPCSFRVWVSTQGLRWKNILPPEFPVFAVFKFRPSLYPPSNDVIQSARSVNSCFLWHADLNKRIARFCAEFCQSIYQYPSPTTPDYPTATYNEAVQAYEDGKEVIHCLAASMKR